MGGVDAHGYRLENRTEYRREYRIGQGWGQMNLQIYSKSEVDRQEIFHTELLLFILRRQEQPFVRTLQHGHVLLLNSLNVFMVLTFLGHSAPMVISWLHSSSEWSVKVVGSFQQFLMVFIAYIPAVSQIYWKQYCLKKWWLSHSGSQSR